MPAPESHQYRQVAESFGIDPERYDRARPRYPEALVARILAGSPGPDILDVGCGTGIAARQFRAAGARVLGVEPDERMADFARRTGIEVEGATFEAWDSAGRTFDAVVAGQAWHWVDPVAGAAKAARVLRPGGRLAAFWHVFEPPQDVAEAVGAVYRRVVLDSPFSLAARPGQADRNATLFTSKAADGMREAGGSASRSSGGMTGSGPIPGTSGSSSWPRPAPSPRFRRTSGPRCWRAPARRCRRWAEASP
jgi:SAM-dependent methyltransferase